MTTTNTLDNTVTDIVMGVIKTDPIAWARKGNKIVYGDIRELTPDANLNIRFRKGASFFGVTSDTDSLDIPSMRQGIVDGNGILEPLLVSVRPDGGKIPLRGNRRTYAGLELVADPTCPTELFENLTKRTPMILLNGLTTEQEKELINDQTQKQFLRSEVVRHIFELRKNKWSFDRIALLYWETLGKFTGNHKKISEVRDLTDPTAKRAKITQWLRGTLDNYLIWGYDLGAFVQKCIMLSVMKSDGIIAANGETAYFNTEKNSQKRIAELKKAAQADGSKHNAYIPQDGSEFKRTLDKFHAEDFGTIAPKAPKGPKMMSRTEIEGIQGSFQSNVIRQMLVRILGGEAQDLSTLDEFSAICESKEMLVQTYLPRLKPEVAVMMRLAFLNPDPTDLQNFLEANTVDEEVTETETEVATEMPEMVA